jgi:hypothetical protein
MGGTRKTEINSPANLLCLCSRCHWKAEVGDRDGAQRAGLILGANEDPTTSPVHLKRGWVFLDNEGGYG